MTAHADPDFAVDIAGASSIAANPVVSLDASPDASLDATLGVSLGASLGANPAASTEPHIGAHARALDSERVRADFERQGAFLYLEDFLPPALAGKLADDARALLGEVNRNYLPGHKQGGSVSRHTIDRLAPAIAQLYRSKELIGWLERTCGEALQLSPEDDPHAYALYYYTRPGDHIGWHYDTSYYDGRRYTVLLGVIDDSSCRLDYELHTRNAGVADEPGSVQIPPGGLVFFDGDKLRHRISPMGANEIRVSLTFEYVTNPNMRAWRRFVSNMKDAIAYFGFKQVFRQLFQRRAGPGTADNRSDRAGGPR